MNVSVHVVTGGVISLIVAKSYGYKLAFVFFLSSVIVDVDHYIEYVVRFNKISLRQAFRFYETNKHMPKISLNILHSVEFVVLFFVAAILLRNRVINVIFLGYVLHVLLDALQGLYHKRMSYRWWSLIDYLRTLKKS